MVVSSRGRFDLVGDEMCAWDLPPFVVFDRNAVPLLLRESLVR